MTLANPTTSMTHPIDPDCPLCEMEQETHWYYEDDNLVIADAVGTGKPFVVVKGHTDPASITDLLIHADIKPIVEEIFGEHDLEERMNHIEDHWHAHIRDTEVSFDEARAEYDI